MSRFLRRKPARIAISFLAAVLLPLAWFAPQAAAKGSGSNLDRYLSVGKCVTIQAMIYCTDVGFLGSANGPWRKDLERALSVHAEDDTVQDVMTIVERLEKLSPSELEAHNKEQIARASSAANKATAVESVTSADSKTEPEATLGASASKALTKSTLPTKAYIIYDYYTRQINNRYCGPATMQAIDWADDGYKDSQHTWARIIGYRYGVGTPTIGIVNAINNYTNWDTKAGTYGLYRINNWTLEQFWYAHQLNIGRNHSPVVENPLLQRRFFSYLRYDHGGHFQTGRGYNRNLGTISVFEPYNEASFYSGGYPSGRVQYVPAALLLSAIKANLGEFSY